MGLALCWMPRTAHMREMNAPLRLFTVPPRTHLAQVEQQENKEGCYVARHREMTLAITDQGDQLEFSGNLTRHELLVNTWPGISVQGVLATIIALSSTAKGNGTCASFIARTNGCCHLVEGQRLLQETAPFLRLLHCPPFSFSMLLALPLSRPWAQFESYLIYDLLNRQAYFLPC